MEDSTRERAAGAAADGFRYNVAPMTIRALIEVLNNLTTGELSRLSARVVEVRDQARALGLAEVVAILEEALELLAAGDLKGFRRKIQHAVSRLGHAREPQEA